MGRRVAVASSMSRMRHGLIASLGFAVLLWPSWWLYLVSLREGYRGLEFVGVIGRGGNLWGQVLGRNIPAHAEWVGLLARFLAGAAGYGPACVAAWWLYLMLRRGGLGPPACLGAGAWRFAAAVGVFAVVLAGVGKGVSAAVQGWVFSMGVMAGCEYTAIGRIMIGPGGPFGGGGPDSLFNWMWRNVPWNSAVVVAFVVGLAVFDLVTRACVRGVPGRCGACGYDATGLAGDRCPECGAVVAVRCAV